MIENERYILDYLNHVDIDFSLCVRSILRDNISEKEYKHLNDMINEYIEEVTKILNKINLKRVPANNFFNDLFLLRNLPNRKVHLMLEQYNYENLLKYNYKDALQDINNNILPHGDKQKTMDFLLETHYPFKNAINIYEFYLKYTLLNEKPTSLNALRSIMIDYTKMHMLKYVENPEVYIVSKDKLDNAVGYAHHNKVWLCDEEIRRMYKYGYFRPLETVFHEVMHVSQYKDIYIDKNGSDRCMTMIKDEILSHIIKDYYKDNHLIMLSEVEANINYRKMILAFFDRNNLNLVDNDKKYEKAIENYGKLLNYRNRIVNNEVRDIDELFNEKIMFHPEYLSVYERLNDEYKIDLGDIVIRRDDFTGGYNDRNK